MFVCEWVAFEICAKRVEADAQLISDAAPQCPAMAEDNG